MKEPYSHSVENPLVEENVYRTTPPDTNLF